MIKINLRFLGYIVLVVVACGTSLLGLYISEKIKQSEKPIIIQPIQSPSQYPDWNVIKGENVDSAINFINVASSCPVNGCINNSPATVDFDGLHKSYAIKGKFSRAYLYVEALVDYRRPLTSWDDVYFKINDFGGHLIANDNLLPVPPSDSSRYLYDLSSVSYFSTIGDKANRINKHNNINLFSLLQDGININTWVSISSNRPGRVIKEASIYYECLQGSDCSIEEINNISL